MVDFRILGNLEAESAGKLLPLGWPGDRRVLATLLLEAGRLVPVPRLVDATWDDDPPATASKQVKNAVARLRTALGEASGKGLIETVPGGYRLGLDGCTIDARVFEAGVAAAGLAVSDGKTAEAVVLLRSALALWRGPVLGGLAGRGLQPAVAGLEERRVTALEMCLGLELALGRAGETLGELTDLVAGYPLREKLAELHMVALYRCGRQAEALAVYRTTRELLASELGLDPGPGLQRLQQQILTADPALKAPDQPPAPAVPQVRHSLPTDTAVFTGRGGELDRIFTVVKDAAAAGGVVTITAIDGMPGVGKTTLAVHTAHALASDFPDRQMFVDLHAHTPGRDPVLPQDALAGLLTATGVDPRYLPDDLEGRAAMWRDRMAGQRTLLVLDNAAGSSQVAPLLPGTAGCVVLVTSRRHLGDLPGSVTPVPLDTLPPPEAELMFVRLAPRAVADPVGLAEVVALAGFLPLAISLLARVLARHPSWTLGDLARETRARLLTLTAENSSVAAAFEVSYQCLDPASQRFFGLLGVHPGAVTDAYAAAALAGISLDEAAGQLEALQGEGLLTETGYRRYGMHDLIRRYARDRAASSLASGESERALDRLLDYYQHTAALAGDCLARQARPGLRLPVPAGVEIPALEDAESALAWLRGDRASLLACLDLAVRTGQPARAIALTAGLAAMLRRDGPLADAVAYHGAAVDAARRLNDRLGEASALVDLGSVQHLMGDHPSAGQALAQALDIHRHLGERRGEADALRELGTMRLLTGEHLVAAEHLDRALSIFRDLGDRRGEADTLCERANARRAKGEYLAAIELFGQALGIFRDLGDRLGEAEGLTDLGIAQQMKCEYPGAAYNLQQALGIFRALGDRHGEAWADGNLGIVRYLMGEYPAAAQSMQRALDIWHDLGTRQGEADALAFLGLMRQKTGDFTGAAQVLRQALSIFQEISNRPGEANALAFLGALRRSQGDLPGSAEVLDQALGIYRDLGDLAGEAEALDELGTLARIRGDVARAREHHQRSLDLARTIDSARHEAHALASLGRCTRAAGQAAQAEALLRQAYEIFDRIGAAETGEILAELSALTRPDPSPTA